MIVVHQVLKKPIAELKVEDLAGHGLAVRKLIGCIDDLPARAKSLLKDLVDCMDYETWETCDEHDTERHHSPSASMLAMLGGVTDRTIRRAYVDAERLGVFERVHRGWNTNRFRLRVDKVLELAQRSQAARLEARRGKIRAWMRGYQDERGRFARRPAGQGERAGAAPAAVDQAPEAPAFDLSELGPSAESPAEAPADVFADFPPDDAERLALVIQRARADVAQRGRVYWKSLGSCPRALRLELAVLCIALQELITPDQPRRVLVHTAGNLAKRFDAVWSSMGYGPIELIVRDVEAMLWKWGPEWHKKLRPRDWPFLTAQALEHVRQVVARRSDDGGFGALLAMAADVQHVDISGRALDAVPADNAEREALEALVRARGAVLADIEERLEALPALPDVSGLRPWDEERRRVNRERASRAELADVLKCWARAVQGDDLQGAQEAAGRAAGLAAGLGLGPPL